METEDESHSQPQKACAPIQKRMEIERTTSFKFTLEAPARRFSKMMGVSPIRLPDLRQR